MFYYYAIIYIYIYIYVYMYIIVCSVQLIAWPVYNVHIITSPLIWCFRFCPFTYLAAAAEQLPQELVHCVATKVLFEQ